MVSGYLVSICLCVFHLELPSLDALVKAQEGRGRVGGLSEVDEC